VAATPAVLAATQSPTSLGSMAAAGALVQVVDVLRDDRQLGPARLQVGQGEVARMRLCPCHLRHAPDVAAPHQIRVGPIGGGCRQSLRVELAPQPALPAAKRRHAAVH